jgi:serine/threonine protein kinase/Tol biopolymer transport system component
MRLNSGTRLGSYEIMAPLGAGGMGEVYRARDTRLDREVALKVLPAHLAASLEARARLEREARVISQMSHPHVCALYDVGRDDGVDFLVMELLEGETLATRLRRGALPLAEVYRLGREMADALHAAHRRGLVHRDLKPANVMVTGSGVKVLDFGLARPVAPPFPTSADSERPTVSSPEALTAEGTVLGTLHYLSPEQLEGRPADARSDLFSFGAVLYEMATGRRAFDGETSAAVAAAVASADPPAPSSIRGSVPVELDRLVRACLTRDPDRRWQSSHDASLQLATLGEPSPPSTPRPGRGRLLTWALALLAAAAALAALWRPASAPPPVPPIRFTIPQPPGQIFLDDFSKLALALSPDGSRLAFVARPRRGGSTAIWLRSLSDLDSRRLEGTDGALGAFWSPDGRSLAFFTPGQLKRLDLSGGAPVPLCDLPPGLGFSGSWGADGVILFAPLQGEALYRVTASGGPVEVELGAEAGSGSPRLNYPAFLPDGRRFLYLARRPDRSGQLILVERDGSRRPILDALSHAVFVAPGYLVFARETTLIGQGFDPSSGELTGQPFSIASPVRYMRTTAWSPFTASRNGTVVYHSGRDTSRLVWLDRSGRQIGKLGPPGSYGRLRLSPDGRHLLFGRFQPNTGNPDIWILDLEREVETRLTVGPGTEAAGVWLPDQSGVVFVAPRGGPPHLYRKDLASGEESELLAPGAIQDPQDVSPDGRVLLFEMQGEDATLDLWTLGLGPGMEPVPQPQPFLHSRGNERDARISPDGRLVAFVSDESGRQQVYLATFPAPGPRIRVSKRGASTPRWCRGGRELVYLSGGTVMAVPVRARPSVELGTPVALFARDENASWTGLEPSGDGQRFLVSVREAVAAEEPFTVVVNALAGPERP